MERSLATRKEDVDVEYRPHKKMDLRNVSNHSSLSYKKFELGLIYENENITTHSRENPKTVQHKHDEVKKVLLDGLKTMKKKGFQIMLLYIFP